MRITLTDLTIQHLKPDGRQHNYRCKKTPGFGLRLSQKGGKSFFVIIDRSYHHLGKYPATSLAEARKKASELNGSAPVHGSLSFAEAVDTYLTTYVRPNYRPRSASEVERLLKKCAFKQLKGIMAQDISAVLDRQARSAANHLHGVLRTFFNWCERRELVSANPMRKLTKPHKEQARDRVLTGDEIRRVWDATQEGTAFNSLIRLCLLTGQRRGELSAIEGSWIREGCITFPKEVTKNRRAHTLPLTTLSAGYAAGMRAIADGSIGKHKRRLDQVSGVENWTVHDLRRTVSTNLAQMGTPPHIIDRILNHASGGVHSTYNRYSYLPEVGEALKAWERRLVEIGGQEA